MPVPASLPEHRMSSSTGRLERREEAAALPARSGLHLEGRTNGPEHPARLCLAVAVPSSSSCCPSHPLQPEQLLLSLSLSPSSSPDNRGNNSSGSKQGQA